MTQPGFDFNKEMRYFFEDVFQLVLWEKVENCVVFQVLFVQNMRSKFVDFSMVMFSALCKRRHFGMHFIDYRKIRKNQIYETFNEFCFQSGDDIFQKEMVGSSLIIDLLGKN